MSDEAEKTQKQAIDFANRLTKRYKHLKKWARRSGVTSFRIYDRDIPEVPLSVDVYEKYTIGDASPDTAPAKTMADTSNLYLHIALYERPYQKEEKAEEAWLCSMKQSAAQALGIPLSNIITKERKKQRGESAQYEKQADKKLCFTVREHGVLFTVNLSDYLDTGLFFDHRPLRNTVRDSARGKHVLNLFCYTGSFSCYAALGGAKSVDSVDLSKTYLQWAKNNFLLNNINIDEKTAAIDGTKNAVNKYRFIEEDVTSFVNGAARATKALRNRWDIIILDPPTFSNSKRMKNVFDINACWSELCATCLKLLTKDGVLYFSTNSHTLKFNESLLPDATCTDITAQTVPEDFIGKKSHRCWKIVPNRAYRNTQ